MEDQPKDVRRGLFEGDKNVQETPACAVSPQEIERITLLNGQPPRKILVKRVLNGSVVESEETTVWGFSADGYWQKVDHFLSSASALDEEE